MRIKMKIAYEAFNQQTSIIEVFIRAIIKTKKDQTAAKYGRQRTSKVSDDSDLDEEEKDLDLVQR